METQSPKRWQKVWHLIRASLDGSEQSYTSGSINRAIVLLFIPLVLEMVMVSLFATVDVFFVARIGIDAAAWSAMQAIYLGLSVILGVLGWIFAEDILRGAGDVLWPCARFGSPTD